MILIILTIATKMHLKNLNLTSLRDFQKIKKCTLIVFAHLPSVLLYFICLRLFYYNVSDLTEAFLQFKTLVQIKYEPTKRLTIPGITVCSCNYKTVTCSSDLFRDKVLYELYKMSANNPVYTIFHNLSFPEKKLIQSCYFIADPSKPEDRIKCSDIAGPPVASIQDGRKCFTYFLSIFDQSKLNISIKKQLGKIIQMNDWQVQIVINFGDIHYLSSYPPDWTLRLQNSEVIMAVHSDKKPPIFLETEFIPIAACTRNKMRFAKQINKLLPSPYNPSCQEYYKNRFPRAASECLSRCLIVGLQAKLPNLCLHKAMFISDATFAMISGQYGENLTRNIKFCKNAYMSYINFTAERKKCMNEFCGRDCDEENYSMVVDNLYHFQNNYVLTCKIGEGNSVVTVLPEKALVEKIEHYPQLDFYEFLGSIGCNMHFFLSLSFLQLYDIIWAIVMNVKKYWIKFVEW